MKLLSLLPIVLALAFVVAAPAARAEEPAQTLSVGTGAVEAHSSDVWNLYLQAGVTYRIMVVGDGDTDLDGFLRDEDGILIDSDTDLTDVLVLSVTPIWSGPFTLEIQNLGHVFNRYVLEIVP